MVEEGQLGGDVVVEGNPLAINHNQSYGEGDPRLFGRFEGIKRFLVMLNGRMCMYVPLTTLRMLVGRALGLDVQELMVGQFTAGSPPPLAIKDIRPGAWHLGMQGQTRDGMNKPL